jgi:transcriptional regulator with XRE-family HTH domain
VGKLPFAKMDEVGNLVPSSAAELGTRIAQVVARYPSRRAAAKACDRTDDMVSRYEKGLADPPISVLAKLAEPHGISLDWVGTGQGAMERGAAPEPVVKPLDTELLRSCVGLIEELAPSLGAAQKAEAIALLYELALEEPADSRVVWLQTKGPKIARLAG